MYTLQTVFNDCNDNKIFAYVDSNCLTSNTVDDEFIDPSKYIGTIKGMNRDIIKVFDILREEACFISKYMLFSVNNYVHIDTLMSLIKYIFNNRGYEVTVDKISRKSAIVEVVISKHDLTSLVLSEYNNYISYCESDYDYDSNSDDHSSEYDPIYYSNKTRPEIHFDENDDYEDTTHQLTDYENQEEVYQEADDEVEEGQPEEAHDDVEDTQEEGPDPKLILDSCMPLESDSDSLFGPDSDSDLDSLLDSDLDKQSAQENLSDIDKLLDDTEDDTDDNE